jgi:peptidyl-tRNA hydrolase
MRALAHLRSEVKDFFDFAIDPILLVRKQKGLEKVPTSCNSVCQLLSYKRTLSSLGLLFMILFRIGRAEKLRYISMGSILVFQVPTLVSPM